MAEKEATVEEKSVSMDELRSGITLRTGSQVRVIVEDGKRTLRLLFRSPADAPQTQADAPPTAAEAPQKTPATLTILAADGAAGHDPGKLRIGAGNPLQLKWSVQGATKATLSARSLVEKNCEASGNPSSAERVSNDHLVSAEIELPLDAQGSGSGVVHVDPGPCGSTEYSITVTPQSGAPVAAKATAFVANFNARIELPDGSDYARNKPCVLEIPGQDPVKGTTNESGELWLWLPNVAAESATLRLFDGDTELASWAVGIAAEEGVPGGAVALNDASAGDSVA